MHKDIGGWEFSPKLEGMADDSGRYHVPSPSAIFHIPDTTMRSGDIMVMLGENGPYRIISDRGTEIHNDTIYLDVTIEKHGVETAIFATYKVADVMRDGFVLTYYLEKTA